MKLERYIVVILLFLTNFLGAQSEFRFNNLTINDGLSQSSVTCIIQDDLNALWIGTQDGLNRYDGRSFEVFTADETEGLESQFINCAIKDEYGNLWFGTNNGITQYNLYSESFSTYKPTDVASLNVLDIEEDDDGNIWIASAQSGVFMFDTKKQTFKNYSTVLSSKKTNNIECLDNGSMLLSTEQGELFVWKPSEPKAQVIPILRKVASNLSINKIVYDSGDRAQLATNQGVYDFRISTQKTTIRFKRFDNSQGLQNISDLYHQDGVGWLICTNNNGLFVIDDEGKIRHSREDIFQKTALLFNELNTIYRDHAGIFWIGSKRGLSNFNPIHRGILGVGPSGDPERGIPNASVWSFAESKQEKKIYIGTDGAVSIYDKRTGKFKQFVRKDTPMTQGSGGTSVLAIEEITPNQLLVACADGLFKLSISGDSYTYTQLTNIEGGASDHSRAYSIIHWKDNLYWVGTKDGALLYNATTGNLKAFEHNPENPENTISKGICRLVFRDMNDRIWFATSTGGLNSLSEENGKEIIHPYEHNYIIKATSTDYISSIYQSKKGEYWFGTPGTGLIKWDERVKKVTVYSKKDGLPNNVIYGVVAGRNESLWLSTNKGLCNFDTKTKKAKNYTELDGLMSNEFNLGAYMKSSDGILYFGGIYGYNYFHPKEVLNAEKDVSVVFTKFKLDNEWLKPNSEGSPLDKPIFVTREIALSYKQRSFTIRFQPSDLSNPELVNYKYILEGSEEGEIMIGTDNEIHFNALSHGNYVLKVYARLGNGKWSESPAVMKINIESPIWFTWWFWCIFAAVAALAIRIFIRFRIEATRREQVRLEMKIRDRTREIKEQNKKIESQKKKIEEERNKVIDQQRLLQREKDKTEKLLKNVIPESTAEELKKRGKARARAYKTVSVLFTDFVGFTKISDRMTATELVKKLDVYFTKFDEIIVSNNLEKIKTIGDAYMCAGGVPVRNNTNPIDACLAAIQIQSYMLKRKNDAIANGREYWELRLGINTGEVTAGVIGSERLQYDIWGATVNQAQRMEMLGEPGKVTITGDTFKHIEPYFECTFLGKAQSKSRGLIDMYVVEQIKPELSERGEGIYPNKRFNQIVNLHHYSSINYYKAERHIMRVLEQRLSKKLHYHSIAHTKDVVKAVERLALLENVTDEGLFLLKSAATYHDAGFVEQYEKNELIGARLADEILPKYGYTEKHIERIKELIYVTEIPHQPKDLLEEIICDADLDYLGRDDFHEISDKLMRELIEHGKIRDAKQWDEIQVAFLTNHRYFTKTAKKTRKKKKEDNLQEVITRLKRDQYEA